jgi:hypothetical protein
MEIFSDSRITHLGLKPGDRSLFPTIAVNPYLSATCLLVGAVSVLIRVFAD